MNERGPSEDDAALPLVDDVYQRILSQFFSRTILPGARITIDGLARQFGVSQTPVRVALTRLEASGFVVRKHLIGYSAAAPMTREEFEHLFEFRLMVEPSGAALAAQRRDDETLRALHQLDESMRSISPSDDPHLDYAVFARVDGKFHDSIAACGNPILGESLARLHVHLNLFRLVFSPRVTQEACAEHGHLLDAIEAREAEIAADQMRIHLERSRDRLRMAFDTA